MTRFRFYALKLCLIIILIYILQTTISGFTEVFILNQQSYYQIWRFLTAVFLHGSLVHLLYNLFALALFGSILEKFIGGKKFLLVFFLSGIFANIIAVNFYNSSLGASGSVYGILGTLVILKPLMMIWAFGFPMPMFLAGILWVAGGLFGLIIPGNTGHIAHLSGIAVGFIFGIFLRLRKKRKLKQNFKIEVPTQYIDEWENRYMKR